MPSLNPNQFNTEQSILRQGNPSEELTRSRGIQNDQQRVWPSFSSDYTAAQLSAGPSRRIGGGRVSTTDEPETGSEFSGTHEDEEDVPVEPTLLLRHDVCLAAWKPVVNHGGNMSCNLGLILHVQEGNNG